MTVSLSNFNTEIGYAEQSAAQSLLCVRAITDMLESTDIEKQKAVTRLLASHYNNPSLGEEQIESINHIFKYITEELHAEVRATLAAAVHSTPHLPHELAFHMACDIEAVAAPVLRMSEVLTEDDLIHILRSSNEKFRAVAIAQRKKISEMLSETLIGTRHEEAILALLHNKNARFSSRGIRTLVENYAEHIAIASAMIEHKAIPITVTEALMARSSSKIKAILREKYDRYKYAVASRIIDENHALQTILRIQPNTPYNIIKNIIDHLKRQNRLNPAFVLSALFAGKMQVFEVALSALSGIALNTLRYSLHEEPDGLYKILDKTPLGEPFYPIIVMAFECYREANNQKPGEPAKTEDTDYTEMLTAYREAMVSRLQTKKIKYCNFALKTLQSALDYSMEAQSKPAARKR